MFLLLCCVDKQFFRFYAWSSSRQRNQGHAWMQGLAAATVHHIFQKLEV